MVVRNDPFTFRIKERHSRLHRCQKCKGKYIRTRGKWQKLCLLCLKVTNPIAYEATYPFKIVPTVLPVTARQRGIESNGTLFSNTKTVVAEIPTNAPANDEKGSGQDLIFRFTRRKGIRDVKRRETMIGMIKEGISYAKIALHLGMNHSSIIYWARKLGLRDKITKV